MSNSPRREAEIQSACLSYLAMLPDAMFWRSNTGAFKGEYKGRRRFIRYGVAGQPDIQGIYRGRYIGLEVKTPKGKQNDNQIEFEGRVKSAGGFYRVVRSIDDLIAAVAEIKEGK